MFKKTVWRDFIKLLIKILGLGKKLPEFTFYDATMFMHLADEEITRQLISKLSTEKEKRLSGSVKGRGHARHVSCLIGGVKISSQFIFTCQSLKL